MDKIKNNSNELVQSSMPWSHMYTICKSENVQSDHDSLS